MRNSDIGEKYHNMHLRHLLKCEQTWKVYNIRRITEQQELEISKMLENRFLLILMTWFRNSSWEDQIQIALVTNNDYLIKKLDSAQMAAYRILS